MQHESRALRTLSELAGYEITLHDMRDNCSVLARHAVAAIIAAMQGQDSVRKQALEDAAQLVLGGLACSICGEIDDCRCDFDVAVSAGPCKPSSDRLAAAIRKLAG